MKSNCCKVPIKNVSGNEGTGYMMCTKCNKPCDMETEFTDDGFIDAHNNNVTAEMNTINLLTMDNDNKEKLTAPNWPDEVRLRMIEKSQGYSDPLLYQYGYYDGYQYASLQSADLLKQIEELTTQKKQIADMYDRIVYKRVDLIKQIESLSQVIESQKMALRKELIDFLGYQYQGNMYFPKKEIEDRVDDYLKTIRG